MTIYKRELTETNGTQLEMPSGSTSYCWKVGFPPAGEITRLLLRQSAGSDVDLTVNLYDRQVCTLGDGSSSVDADEMTQEMAKIIPTQSVTAGDTLELRQGTGDGGPWSYRNREGSFSVPVRAVYIKIEIDANADGKEFELALEVSTAARMR